MTTVLWWLAQNTIAIAFLIPLVAAACRLCRNRPAVQHVLWAVVLLKFVTPPLVCWPWTLPQFSPPLGSSRTAEMAPLLGALDERVTSVLGDVRIGARADGEIGIPRRLAQPVPSMALVPALLTGVWIVGMVVCSARQLRAHRPDCFARETRQGEIRGARVRNRGSRYAAWHEAAAGARDRGHRLSLRVVTGPRAVVLARVDGRSRGRHSLARRDRARTRPCAAGAIITWHGSSSWPASYGGGTPCSGS